MNKSSWFPLKRFTKTGCHFDWMLGATKFKRVKDFLIPSKIINMYETVFWNRTLNVNVSLSSYQEFANSGDPEKIKKLESIGLPTDVKL